MPHNEALQGIGSEFLIAELEIFQRHFRPGRSFVAACRAKRTKYSIRQLAGTFTVTIAAKNDHEFFTMHPGDEDPIYLADMI